MAIAPSIEIDRNNKRVFLQIQNAPGATERGIRNAFYLIGKDLRRTSRNFVIRGPKTGRLYRLPGRQSRHRASAPGQPPANRTGTLQKSVDFLVKGSDQMLFGVDSDADYAKFLELGTTKMEKREFLIKAIEQREKITDNYFNGQINKNLSRLP